MRLKNLVPIVGFCAVSFLSSSAIAHQHEWWAANCKTKLCLQATEKGQVIVSECKLGLETQLQEWEVAAAKIPISQNKTLPNENLPIENLTSGYIKSFGISGQCLTMTKGVQVVTRDCEKNDKNQIWSFPPLRGMGEPSERPGIRVKQIRMGHFCLEVKDDKLSVAKCKTDGASQSWFWINVGNACPSCKLEKPKYPSCSFAPPFECTRDKNECGNPSNCLCPALYTYNPATGNCDLKFRERPQEGDIEILAPECSLDPPGACTKDINICGNPSYCECPTRPVPYKYNPATRKCDLANPR